MALAIDIFVFCLILLTALAIASVIRDHRNSREDQHPLTQDDFEASMRRWSQMDGNK